MRHVRTSAVDSLKVAIRPFSDICPARPGELMIHFLTAIPQECRDQKTTGTGSTLVESVGRDVGRALRISGGIQILLRPCDSLIPIPTRFLPLVSDRSGRPRFVKAAPAVRADCTRNNLACVRLQEMGAPGATATLVWSILIECQRLWRRSDAARRRLTRHAGSKPEMASYV